MSSLTDDILFLILNHHNYNNISDIRLQILVEADLLVNYMEDADEYAALHICDTDLFKTKTGFELKMKIMGSNFKAFLKILKQILNLIHLTAWRNDFHLICSAVKSA